MTLYYITNKGSCLILYKEQRMLYHINTEKDCTMRQKGLVSYDIINEGSYII